LGNNRPHLWEQADRSEIENMPGLDADYDIPEEPALVLLAADQEQNDDKIMTFLREKKIVTIG